MDSFVRFCSVSTVDFKPFCVESILCDKSCLSCQLLYAGQRKLVNPRLKVSLTPVIGLSLSDTTKKYTGFVIVLNLTNTLQVPKLLYLLFVVIK